MPESRTDPIGRLVEVCEALARGSYDDANALFTLAGEAMPDDTARLAEAFGMMLVRVEAREMHLQQLIAQLRETQRRLEDAKRRLERENVALLQDVSLMTIGIDADRRAAEVAQVTGTAFFATLAGAAQGLRRRRRPSPRGA